jgi:hypothetical protein
MRIMSFLTLALVLARLPISARAQQPSSEPPWTLLWQNGAPGALGDGDADKPAARAMTRCSPAGPAALADWLRGRGLLAP